MRNRAPHTKRISVAPSNMTRLWRWPIRTGTVYSSNVVALQQYFFSTPGTPPHPGNISPTAPHGSVSPRLYFAPATGLYTIMMFKCVSQHASLVLWTCSLDALYMVGRRHIPPAQSTGVPSSQVHTLYKQGTCLNRHCIGTVRGVPQQGYMHTASRC